METFLKDLAEGFSEIERNSLKNEAFYLEAEKNLEKYIERARDTLKKKLIINPKPQKRFARIAESGSDEESEVEFKTPLLPVSRPPENVITSSDSGALRPVRSAKIAASKNLKEQPQNLKLRNDNNMSVVVKSERISMQERMSKSRDSLKENSNPKENRKVEEVSKEDVRRSQSVEIIPIQAVEIDMTHDDSDRMPPPAMPIQQKKAKAKKVEEVDPTQPLPIRVTRSKIKKEKVSVGKTQSETIIEKNASETLRKSQSDSSVLQKTVSAPSTKPKKKYPMPILVKIERTSEDKRSSKEAVDTETKSVDKEVNDETFNLPNVNETVTIKSAPINNETITLESAVNANLTVTLEKNTNDSLMTEDNDEEEQESMHVPLSQLSSIPNALKLKKNEVFNPFMASPVKKKVEAFEKHAMDAKTPEKGKMSSVASATKYNTLKNGTPSKIALYSTKGTTPMSNAKQKYIAAVSTATSSSGVKKSVQKKFSSMSHENQEELKKVQSTAQLEEKKKQREEKQKQVQLQREALERQKREQTLQIQKEREEKFKKLMQEKEEQKRIEALKKKQLKEQQERKYAEERARKEEALVPPTSASKDDSLYYKVQKQIVVEKQLALKKAECQKKVDKNAYDFDMLYTDDSTDDERSMAKKRPDPPQWSKKQHRKKLIILQSKVNPDIVDTLFSTQPINVDLRAIFPAIDSHKLARNSSAVWNTPPRYSVYAKSLQNNH